MKLFYVKSGILAMNFNFFAGNRYMFDFETAENFVGPHTHEAFFVTAVSNSCMNPIIYGNYINKYWQNIRRRTCRSSPVNANHSETAASSRWYNPSQQRTEICNNLDQQFVLSPHCHSANSFKMTL